MLGWSVEMELLSEEVGFLDVGVKQIDGCSAHKVLGSEVVPWLLGLLDWKEERFNGLIELVGSTRIDDFVVKVEGGVFKIFFYGHSRIKVNWSSSDHARVLVEVKALSWSLSDGILV